MNDNIKHGRYYDNIYIKSNIDDKYITCLMVKRSTGNTTSFIVDLDDYEKVRKYIWYPHHDKTKPDTMIYVLANSKGEFIRLHRCIMNVTEKELVVDHINHNPLDNRKENLRVVTVTENNRNLSLRKSNTSGVIGVYYNITKKRWIATKYFNGKLYALPFKTKEEAIEQRKIYDKMFTPDSPSNLK